MHPTPKSRHQSFRGLLVAAGAIVTLASAVVPANAATFADNVDTGVIVLFVPLCALLVAIIVEVFRATMRGQAPLQDRNEVRSITAWKPEHGDS
jgi:hypothetical protein